jgi:hypothetical protein
MLGTKFRRFIAYRSSHARGEDVWRIAVFCQNEVMVSMKRECVVLISIALWGTACPAEEPPLSEGMNAERHEVYFPIGPDATHVLGEGYVTCQYCHGGGETYKEFFCTRCHTSVAEGHSQVTGFVNENAACLGCHPDGTAGAEGFTHQVFPVFDGAAHSPENDSYMQATATQPDGHKTHCTSCHVDSENAPAETRCADCHAGSATDDAHAGSPVQVAYNAVNDCKKCHWTTPVPDALFVANHNAATCINHYDVDSCFDCHEQAYQAGDMAWAFDFDMPASPMTCAVCHPTARAYPAACP